MKTFVDNVCRQVVEHHLLRNLHSSFTPTTVLGFSDEELKRIASEPASRRERRRELRALQTIMQESSVELEG